MNCISWSIGHMAWQEQRYWLHFAQDRLLLPEINIDFRNGGPASTPPLADVWRAWESITAASDPWLDTIANETLTATVTRDGKPSAVTFGSLLLRTTYHYWFHTGENAAIRQQLGHAALPQFVGDLDQEAPYRPHSTVCPQQEPAG